MVNAWYHATGFGVLQRMVVIILKHLKHTQLQAFFLLLDSFERHKVFKEAAPKTNASNFYILPKSTLLSKQISRMVDSYGNMFVAAECLEIVLGYNHDVVILFRNWVSICVSYLFDLDAEFGAPPREQWDAFAADLLEESMLEWGKEMTHVPTVDKTSQRTCMVCEETEHS